MVYRRRARAQAKDASRKRASSDDVPWTIELAASVICQRWKPAILWLLHHNSRRFVELSRSLRVVSDKVLTQQLRQLERDGLVKRDVSQGSYGRPYLLTEIGRRLTSFLDQLEDWGAHYAAREPTALARHGLANLPSLGFDRLEAVDRTSLTGPVDAPRAD
jgi:DNA-binding HxlR family transcriptional regulator